MRGDSVGAIPDPQNAGQVKPVWGTTESLRLQIIGLNADGSQDGAKMLSLAFPVHPEPWKPDHFGGYDSQGQPVSDQFPFWTGYLAYPDGTIPNTTTTRYRARYVNYEAYFLYDQYENVNFGYQNAAITPPGAPVTATFTAETTTGPDFAGYMLDTSWSNDPAWPTGARGATVSVSYPDASPDWGAGQVTKGITYLFDSASAHALAKHKIYDLIRPDGTKGVDDGTFPISVSSGQEANLPTADDKSAARMVLLTWNGTRVPGELPKPEPIPTGLRIWTPYGSGWSLSRTDPDPTLEISDAPAFKMSLIDGSGKAVPEGAFQVHRCPRFDHWDTTTGCSVAQVVSDSTGVISSITVNGDGAATGYLGVELTKAPVQPGTYYVLVEALGNSYKVRRESDWAFDGSVTAGDSIGAFALCTVRAGEFLDQNFQRVNPIAVQQPTPVYVRVTDYAATGSVPLTVTSARSTGESVGTASVTAARVGASSTYIAPLTLLPEHYTSGSAMHMTPLDSQPQLQVPLGSGPVAAKDSSGAQRASDTTQFNGTVRLRFMKRADANDSDGCMTNPVDSCLTANAVDPTNPGVAQETYIDPTNNFAEVVRLKIDVINPWFPIEVERTGAAAQIAEMANTDYVNDPGHFKRQLFYDGNYGSTNLRAGSPGNVVQLQNGQATLKLASVAEAKYAAKESGNPVKANPYFATISATLMGPGLPSLPLTITQWVDEGSYPRTRNQPDLSWLYSGSTGNNVADWLEMKAMDFYATIAPSIVPEADQVFRQVSQTKVTWTPPAGHESDEAFVLPASTIVQWVPREPWLRYDIDAPYYSSYHGLFTNESAQDDFKDTASHEARHCWQNVLSTLGPYPDRDGDDVFGNAPAGSEELLDAPYVGRSLGGLSNPESDFAGDGSSATTADPVNWVIPVRERNAIRFAAAVIGLPTLALPTGSGSFLSCTNFTRTVGLSTDGSTVSGCYQSYWYNQDVGANVYSAHAGAAVMVEQAVAGTACNAIGVWSVVGIPFTDAGGSISLLVPSLPARVIRVTLVTPKECPASAQVPPQCLSVP